MKSIILVAIVLVGEVIILKATKDETAVGDHRQENSLDDGDAITEKLEQQQYFISLCLWCNALNFKYCCYITGPCCRK